MRNFYTNSLLFLCFSLLTSFSSLAQISANDDTFGVVYGANQVIAGNFLLNDTLNGSQALSSNVTITIISVSNAGISISGTNIVVAGGTPQGTYTLVYQLCVVGSPSTCDTATVTINTQLLANPDSFQASPCGYIGNVLGSGPDLNYVDTLNGEPAVLTPYYTQPGNVLHPATVTLTYISSYPGIFIDSSGTIVSQYGMVQPGTTYTLTYTLCEIAHPNNCSTGYVTLNINPEFIFSSNDDFTPYPIDNTVGGTTLSVLNNDYSECQGNLYLGNSTVSAYNLPSGLTLNPDGTISVAVGTSPGLYNFNYSACLTYPYIGCGFANVTILVTGISTVVANYDNFGTNYPNSTTASVLNNDTLNGAPITSSALITISPLNLPSGFTLNPNGTISIAASVTEGTYTVPYQICNIVSSMDCYVNYAYVVVFKNRIIGKVKFDANSNGCDAGDAYLNYIEVKNINGSNTYTNYTNYNGSSQYYLIGDAGINTVSLTNLPSYFTVTPATQVFNFTTPGSTIAPDFCISINSNVNDLEVVLVPRFQVVPGLPVFYDIWYKNHGSTTLSGQVSFQFNNAKMSFLSSSPSPNITASSLLTYNFSDLAPFESRVISNVKFQVATPPTNNSGDLINFSGAITPVAIDATPLNNSSSLTQTVVNSQDPNDIVVHEGATVTLAQAQQGYLHYTIHFQNIGTSNAINIKVVNDLDPKLDWSTFELVGTSHPCRVKNKNAHNEFLFENINLPGTANEPLSHGYISFKVKPIGSIAVGNVIQNNANIYFDFNAPIATNTATTTVVNNLSNDSFHFNHLNFFPNPVKNSLTISNSSTIDEVEITSILGQKMISKKVNNLQAEINLSELSNGVYFVKVSSESQEKTFKIVKE